MDDVKRMGERLDEVVRNYLGRPAPRDVPEVDWDAEEERVRREWRQTKSEVLLRALEPKYREATCRHELSARWVAAYREGRCINLGIFGPARVGKTWEAAGIARQLLEEDFTPVLLVRVAEMLDKLRPSEDGPEALAQFQAYPVLILDDLGAEKPSEWVSEQLYKLADYRNRKLLPTIVTSNLRPGEIPPDADRSRFLEGRYSDRLLGRLFEGAAQLLITERPAGVAPPTRFGAEL